MDMTNNNNWGYLELKKDPHFKAFTQEEKEMIVSESISFGNDIAKNTIARFGQPSDFHDIKEIIERLGGKINIYQQPFSPLYLAEYNEKEKEITCYIINIENSMMKIGHDNPILKKHSLLALCAAHELFHHLENINSIKASSKVCLERSILKFIKYKYHPKSAREIAAHAFVQALLGLDISPALIVNSISPTLQ